MNNNPLLSKKLKKEFISKIENEWDIKWSQKHGETFDFNELRSQNAFLDDLLDDIEKTIKPNIGLDETSKILISKDNLRRIFRQEQISSWQDKTRNTLAYYAGYNSGWQEFVEKNKDNITPTQSKNNQATKIKILFFCIFFFSILIYVFFRFANKDERKVRFGLSNSILKTYPASVGIDYNLTQIKYSTAQILIENEQFQDINQPTIINLDKNTGEEMVHFFTPGLKKITLMLDDEIVKERFCLISTGNEWYGAIRTKKTDIPPPYEDVLKKSWFGLRSYKMDEKAEPLNALSSPSHWLEYINLVKGAVKYPNEQLHFPVDTTKSSEKKFSRVAFCNVNNYDIDIDSLSLSFDAKRDNIQPEDCLSFMTQLFDENLNEFTFYSPTKCNILTNIYLIEYKWKPKSSTVQEAELESNPNLNKVLEDFKWHHFDIVFKGKTIYFKIDNSKVFQMNYRFNYKKLREIWFVFEGNGHIDNVHLSDTATGKIIFVDNFNR